MPKSFDIIINGEPYTFAGDGILLGGSEKEPVPAGVLGSIVIPSLHAGLGPARDVAPGRYTSSSYAICHKPGLVLPEFVRPSAIDSYARGTPLYPWALAHEKGGPADYAFVIGPKKLYWFDPHVDSPAPLEVSGSDLSALGGDKRYTGSCFVWNKQWIFGFEDDLKQAAGFTAVYSPETSVVFDAASVGKCEGGSSASWSHTCSGTDRLLVIGISTSGSRTVTAVKYNDVDLTLIGQATYGGAPGDGRMYLYYLLNPPTGGHTCAVTFNTGATAAVCGATSWKGVHQTTPLGTFASATGASASPSVDASSGSGEVVLDCLAVAVQAMPASVGPGQTERYNDYYSFIGAGSSEPGVPTTTMSWTLGASDKWAIGGVSIKPSSPGDPTPVATKTDDADKAVSFGEAQRGRVFWTRNQGIEVTEVYWAPQQAVDFEGGGFTKYGPINTDPIRSTWVTLWGGTLFIAREDGSICGTDEAGYISLAMPAPLRRDDSASNPMLSVGFGRQAAPYLDVLLLPAADTVWGLNPHTLAARTFDPASVQNTDADFLRSVFLSVAAVGTHAFLGGLSLLNADGDGSYVGRIYRLVPVGENLTAHAFGADFGANERVISMVPTMRFDSDRDPTTYLYILTDNGTDVSLYRHTLRTDTNPGGAHPTPTVADPVVVLPTLSGDEMQRNISKLFLQVRGRALLPSGGTPQVSFSGAAVDGNTVSIAGVTSSGEFAAAITAAQDAYRIGRSIEFTVELEGSSAGKALYLPLSVDFLWVPSQHDRITVTVLASGEAPDHWGGMQIRRSGKDTVDALMALRNTIITAEFPEGTADADRQKGTVSWTLFVEAVDVKRRDDTTSTGAGEYEVSLTCRKL